MNKAALQLRNLAKRLIAHEMARNKYSETKKPAAWHVFEQLRLHLAAMIGMDGFRALLSRALALAKVEAPWLSEVRIKEDGAFDGMDNLYFQIAPEEFLEGRVSLLAQLLGLLTAFIGEHLTLQLIHGIWPKFPLNDLDVGTER